jgi:hypothetical protein
VGELGGDVLGSLPVVHTPSQICGVYTVTTQDSFLQVIAVNVEYSPLEFLSSIIEVSDDPVKRSACDGVMVYKVT